MRTMLTCKPCGWWLLCAAWVWLAGCASSTPNVSETNAVPPKPLGQIRVATWDVGRFESAASPDALLAFGRVLQQLQPDVVLVQGWPDGDANETETDVDSESAIIERVLQHVAPIPNSRWQVVLTAGQDAAVFTRLPIVRRIDPPIPFSTQHGFAYAGAVLDTGRGTLLVSSFALSSADHPRPAHEPQLQAEAIAATVIAERDRIRPTAVLLGGSWHEISVQRTRQALVTGLDVDRSDLRIAGSAQPEELSPAPLLLGAAGLRLERVWLLEPEDLQTLGANQLEFHADEPAVSAHPLRLMDLTICPGGCD